MKRISSALCGIWLLAGGCQANIESLTNLTGSKQDSDSNPAPGPRGDADLPSEEPTVVIPESPALQVDTELPVDHEGAMACDGTLIARGEGRDLNFDGILQEAEIISVSFVCEDGKEPEGAPIPVEGQCPAHQESSACPDPSDDDPSQS